MSDSFEVVSVGDEFPHPLRDIELEYLLCPWDLCRCRRLGVCCVESDGGDVLEVCGRNPHLVEKYGGVAFVCGGSRV